MRFPDPAGDGARLVAELKDEGLLTPAVIARVGEAMGAREPAGLNAFLLAGADLIPEKPWLSWLIRRHGCHRFGRVCARLDAAGDEAVGRPPDGNAPYRRCADGSVLVAVMRPDLMPGTADRLKGLRLHRAAATLREMRDLLGKR